MTNDGFSNPTNLTGIDPPAGELTVERLRALVQDSHINFLFGAGTSAPYFAPLGNIEDLFAKIDSTDHTQSIKDLARTSLEGHFFDKILAPNIAFLNGAARARSLITSYAAFLSCLNRILIYRRNTLIGKQANIFTTNVDLAFEVSLEQLEINVNDGFAGKLRPRLNLAEYGTLKIRQGTQYEYQSEMPVVNLFKIHGSVAWSQQNDDIYFDHRLTQIENTKQNYDAAKQELIQVTTPSELTINHLLNNAKRRLSAKGKRFAETYEKLCIINPDKIKFATTVLNKTYYELLRRFANELEKENSVLFVHGFSFRDEHIRDLVLRAAQTNPTLQVIVFCYERREGVRMTNLIRKEQIKNGNIFFVLPCEVKHDVEERKITLDTLRDDYFGRILNVTSAMADQIIDTKSGDSVKSTANGQ